MQKYMDQDHRRCVCVGGGECLTLRIHNQNNFHIKMGIDKSHSFVIN